MVIKSISKNHIIKILIAILIVFLVVSSIIFIFYQKQDTETDIPLNLNTEQAENIMNDYVENTEKKSNSYIKWVDFKGTSTALYKLAKLDIDSHVKDEAVIFNWIELMAYLGSKYGGDFSSFKQSDLDSLISKIKNGPTM